MTRAILTRGFSFALLWWVLADGHAASWGLGAVAVVAATAASLRLLPPGAQRIGAVALLRFLGFFLWSSLRSGIQVAALALRPRLDLAPIMLERRLALPPGAPRLLMLNTLTLLPGTIGVSLEEARLRIHVLDARMPVAAELRALETHIARLFGTAP